MGPSLNGAQQTSSFREAFYGYQIQVVAELTDTELEALLIIQPSSEIEPRFFLLRANAKPFYDYRKNMALLMPIFGLLLRENDC